MASYFVDFEEKTYETYFNQELYKYVNVSYAPGQRQEGDIGFDMSVWYPNRIVFWRFMERFFKKKNIFSKEIKDYIGLNITDIEEIMRSKISQMPELKVNLLLQYKRPEFLDGTQSKNGIYGNNLIFATK